MSQHALLPQESAAPNDRKLIEALRHSKVYRQYEKAFSGSTGLPLALRPLESYDLPFHGKKNENPFCAQLADRKGGCTFCLQTQDTLGKLQGAQPHSVQCPFGLTETRVPLLVGDRLLGHLYVGQVFTHAPRPVAFKKALHRLFPDGTPNEKKLTADWKKTALLPAEKYQATVLLLTFFARQLSALCNQIALEEKNAEPAIVIRAREFIAAHKTEPLTLARVARAAGASVFHFCKVFHKSTGLSFTDYVARARMEDARSGLRNPRRRISEIAYDVGFQSLTQFNRTFKRIFGESPSAYRGKLASRALITA
ncbi:MAG: helix-turn-helix domain-containing protein [Chthoniobacterales bacterium]